LGLFAILGGAILSQPGKYLFSLRSDARWRYCNNYYFKIYLRNIYSCRNYL